MKYRKLGRTNFEVSEMGYGAWGIGGHQWLGADDRESLAALRRAIELGLNFIDTALAYGEGHSEQLVAQVVRDAGRRIYVATKVPPKNYLWPAQPGIGIEQVFPYHHILLSTEQSLKNLRLETIDLQQLHVWNPEWIASDEWRRALEELKRSGKVRAVGISINDYQPDSALEIIRKRQKRIALRKLCAYLLWTSVAPWAFRVTGPRCGATARPPSSAWGCTFAQCPGGPPRPAWAWRLPRSATSWLH